MSQALRGSQTDVDGLLRAFDQAIDDAHKNGFIGTNASQYIRTCLKERVAKVLDDQANTIRLRSA